MDDQRERAKDVVCDILAAAGGRIVGKVRLYKAFYAAHLIYWKTGAGTLTDYPIVRMPQGPGIDNGSALLSELADAGRIRLSTEPNGPYTEHVFELTQDWQLRQTDPRHQAVAQAVQWIDGRSAASLSEETHLYSRSWRDSADGDELDIYADLLDDDEDGQLRTMAVAERERIGGVFAI